MVRVLGGTIVARASGPGHSTRAIVRLSGPDACTAVAALATPHGGAAAGATIGACDGLVGTLRIRGAHRIRLAVEVSGVRCECPALALVMPAPRSFTGEDCVELLLAGHPALADSLVEALLRVPGVSAAAPGAFMARAHAAGRIALVDAERIALEIGATHARELEAARHVMDSPLVKAAHHASAELADVLARVEAGIDFTDSEDVVAIARDDLRRRVGAVRDEIAQWIAGSVPIESLRPMPVVALRGAPNAGKSSLFNALLGRTRAVASPFAGTTRDAISEELALRLPGGSADRQIRVLLMDTPGIEDPRSAIDALMQEQARSADHADLILICDPLASGAASGGPPHHAIRVATRADEVPQERRPPADGAIVTSVVTGEGIAELARAIAAAVVRHGGGTGTSHRIAALARHREAMAQASEWIGRCTDAVAEGPGPALPCPELVADALRGALDALGEVTGEITPDDVLGLVFSRFCIGK